MGLSKAAVLHRVMRGLGPRIHLFREKMDGRVRPGHDAPRVNRLQLL